MCNRDLKNKMYVLHGWSETYFQRVRIKKIITRHSQHDGGIIIFYLYLNKIKKNEFSIDINLLLLLLLYDDYYLLLVP